MRLFLLRFLLVRLTSLTTGSGHTGIGRLKSSSFSSVSSWLIPGLEDVHLHQRGRVLHHQAYHPLPGHQDQVAFLHHPISTQ